MMKKFVRVVEPLQVHAFVLAVDVQDVAVPEAF
jgi:hypothetical protein